MTEQDWKNAGFTIEGLGPGMAGWIRNLPNGSYILVTGLGDHDCDLPPEHGSFQIGLYTPQGWEYGPSIHMEIGRNFSPGNIPDEISISQLMIPMLKSFEPALLALPSKTPT